MNEEQNSPVEQSSQPTAPVASQKKKGMTKGTKIVVAVIIGLFVLGAGGTLLRDTLFSGSSLSVSDLVDESEEGIDFKRPESWIKVDSEDADIAYTEDGKNSDDADQGLLITTESLGIDYSTLTDEQKASLGDEFEKQFSNPETLKSGNCEEIGTVTTAEEPKDGYDTSFTVDAECTKFTGRAAQARIKLVVGVAGDDLHLAVVVALSETWDKSGEALDGIIASIRPTAEQ